MKISRFVVCHSVPFKDVPQPALFCAVGGVLQRDFLYSFSAISNISSGA
jgi:hypothetical protein